MTAATAAAIARHRDLGEKLLLTGTATLPEMVALTFALFTIHVARVNGELSDDEIDLPFMHRMREALATARPQAEERA